jgi:SNF2 family DNA or RNA helicase
LQRDIDFISNFQFDLAVADEAHNLASVKTKQHKAAMILRNISKCRMPLTGTPMANTPLDLYALFEFMGDGWSGFASWENFKNFYGVYASPDGDSYKKLVAIQNTPFMKERLARTSFIIRLEEAIPNLPPMLPDTYEVEMSGRQAEVYEALATQLAYEIENELDSSQNASITVNHVLTKLLRLAQVACGFVKYDEVVNPNTLEVLRESRIEFFNPNPKIDGLLDLLQGKNENQKTIIWSTFVPCIKVISEKFTQLGLPHVTFYGDTSDDARLEAERRFNCDVDCRLLIGNPAAGGSGLNLLGYPPHGGDNVPTNCDHHIYYACDWSFIKRSQSQARSYRKGTRVPVRVTDLMVPDTMDEEIRIRVQKKSHTAFELTDIREILGNVLKSIRGVKEFAA